MKLRKEKANYYTKQLSESGKDPKEMWNILNNILPKKNQHTYGNGFDNLTATSFNNFFTNIAGKLCAHFRPNASLPNILTPRVSEDFVIQEVSTNFVYQELKKLKTKKSTGLDGIPARLLKNAASEVAKPLAYLINLTIQTGEIPSAWKEARLTPIFKSGAKNDQNNYRPISVLPLVSKIMERAVQMQLLAFITENGVLSAYQSGFRRNILLKLRLFIW